MNNFKEIINELFYEKTRAILTIIAIAWGTFAIAIMLSIGEGLRLNFASTMANAGSNLLSIKSGTTSKSYHGKPANEDFKFTKRDVDGIAILPNIDNVNFQYAFDASFDYKDKKFGHENVRAVAPNYPAIHNIKVGPKQRFISKIDMEKRNSVVVIGSAIANRIFSPEESPIGTTIYINNHPFTIIGIMEKKAELNQTGVPDSWLSWVPITTYEMLNNPQKIDIIDVSYIDYKKLPQTKANIQKTLALGHGVDPKDPGILEFSDIAEEQAKVNKFFVNIQMFLGVIGGLTLMLAGVGIANVMYGAVKRSTRLIGIRMALGATTKQIVSRYVLESLVATIIGGVIGILGAVFCIYLIRLIPINNSLILGIIGKPQPALSILVFVVVILVLGITGFVAGLFPALKAAKIDPAEALIYE